MAAKRAGGRAPTHAERTADGSRLVAVWLSPEDLAALDLLRQSASESRSGMMRQLLLAATKKRRPISK